MATTVYGDFEWDPAKAAVNARKHGVSFEEASSIFSDPNYLLQPDAEHADRFAAIGVSGLLRILVVSTSSAAGAFASSVPGRPSVRRRRPMRKDGSSKRTAAAKTQPHRKTQEAAVDFSRAIQPHRYARLRPGYKYTVFLEPELWNHFGSPEAVKAALRGLVSASRHVRAAG